MNNLPLLKTEIPGPRSRALARELRRCESRNVTFVSARWPIFWQRAAGANVWDVDGNRFLDLTAAFGVASVGHTNPRVVAALQRQSKMLLHAMGDVHPNELKLNLAKKLVELTFRRWKTGDARVLFTNSGAEAVEAALKTAAMHTKRPGVIAFRGGYHGLTYGALAATSRDDFRAPFKAQLGEFVTHVPFGELPLVGRARRARRRGDANARLGEPSLPHAIGHYGAVIVEPIQGRGGIVVPPDDFLPKLRQFCDEHGLLLIADEVYTGFCRTGRWFACEHWNVVPDIICVGKAMAGGFPISACIARAEVMDSWPESRGEALHTSTFLGNPLGCAAALAAIGEMQRLKLNERAAALGDYVMSAFAGDACVAPTGPFRTGNAASRAFRRGDACVARAGLRLRGKGLMLGLEVGNAVPLVEKMLQRGLIALPEGDRGEVLGLTPPLTITKRQLNFALEVLCDLLR